MRKFFLVVPLLLSGFLIFFDTMLVRLVLPYRETLVALLALQVAIAIVVGWRRWSSGRVAWPALLACAALLLLAVTYRREYSGHSEATVSFESDGVRLAGTVYVPRLAGPHPAIVLVHGSGQFPRRMYRYWAKQLVDLGFVVLAYDKRGVGDSGGHYEGENNSSKRNLEQLARDASAADEAVVARRDVTPHVGLMGISQGGWIAPLAASQNAKVRFLILHSGPAVSVHEENLYSQLTGDDSGTRAMSPSEAERRISTEPPGGFDPRPLLQQLNVTGLWLFGDSDKSIPVQKSVAVLQQEGTGGRPYEYRVFPSANHLLLTRGRLIPDVASGYWDAIVEWAGRMKDRPLATVK